jgi:hypothetical protein
MHLIYLLLIIINNKKKFKKIKITCFKITQFLGIETLPVFNFIRDY